MRFILLSLLLWGPPAFADLVMSYHGFYGRMKKLQQPEYSDITLAFALTGERSGKPCKFYSLKLVSDQHDFDVDIAGNGEISLPYDEALKNANAVLTVLQADNSEPCQVQFRLRSRMRLPSDISIETLLHYRHQFKQLLDDMAGVSKYWLPDVIGVIVEFPQAAIAVDLSNEQSDVTLCEANRCNIELVDTLPVNIQWRFAARPSYLLPLLQGSVK
ncbi:DUF2987 domain-containing protein [Rheinheimera baltica]|uniref:DUF2987 domain-containing protein n=1 Tax=Rheinheimera baltica TaxID=67576 RepID=UPI00273E88BC|nr:DUF2987 domain-containing protein [Rheinheimera baltica]MDP5143348.1 DUF2987 domain-containing protein [Rheinheimera baltica]